MYLRFALSEVDGDSRKRRGILVAAHDLRDERVLSAEEHKVLVSVLKWFNSNLEVPDELEEPGTERAISWFLAGANEPIGKMWDLVHILRNHGLHVHLLKTSDPGKVIHRDKWQVVAFPPRGKRLPG